LFHWTNDAVQAWLHKSRELSPTFDDAHFSSGNGKAARNTHDLRLDSLVLRGGTRESEKATLFLAVLDAENHET
jgi:hypothetical protein